MMNVSRTLAFAAIAATVATVPASAAVIDVIADAADYELDQNNGVSAAGDAARAGATGSNKGLNAVLVFELPVLGGQSIQSANLAFSMTKAESFTHNADLVGIGFQSSADPILEYLKSDTVEAGNEKLQNDILTPTTADGRINTSDGVAGGDANLAAYLQTFYTANPTYAGGSYVFLRLNPDAQTTSFKGFNIETRTGTADLASDHAVLTITAIPEPGALALLALAGPLALRRRRR